MCYIYTDIYKYSKFYYVKRFRNTKKEVLIRKFIRRKLVGKRLINTNAACYNKL